ncbi:glycosyl transferase [Planotetraspora thailandica]|uniref:Glycosyl transferase n=1 Tax=Planotetraspora thailandica TaxID=487172 RepID=A0A8J3XXM0_9ACTN|nr:glycosyl transferase [Planotetraspora thailandica]
MVTRAPALLVLRGLGLGDVLTAVPALRALRRAHPRHRIALAAPAVLTGLLPLIGAVDEVVDVRGPGPVPFHAPDIAVNLHGRGPESIRALLATRPGRLLTHAHPEVPGSEGGPPWDPEAHEVRRWCSLLGWYGITADPGDLMLRRPGADGPGPCGEAEVIVHPGAAAGARRWPPDRFARVAAELERRGRRVVITGGLHERALAHGVCALARLPADRMLAGLTGLPELAALVGRAALVVCGDTGVSHLAAGLGTPSVVVCGPVSPVLSGPPDHPRHITLWAGRTGDPYGGVPGPGLLAIGVSEVLDAARQLLEVRAG